MDRVTHEATMKFASELPDSEFKDSILGSLEKQDYTLALVVCGEAILTTLRRETDLSIAELKQRMQNCSRMEKLEKMVSSLARDARAAVREKKALARVARQQARVWPVLPEGRPTFGNQTFASED